ncbi:MAG: nickel pincer cofactor biosynthesis protein LarB, partial [Verrucomicrobia bacterium]|nr:nickel pincer cofactor biosynthesis protein LarB [Verrucomicrobiota bacterium]
MQIPEIQILLERIEAGELSAADALLQIAPAEDDLGFAHVDLDRASRCGTPEVIYCPGKTPQQVASILKSLSDAGQNVLATRATPEMYEDVRAIVAGVAYDADARLMTCIQTPADPIGHVSVVCAGTSDIPVAEEAALTAEMMGAYVERIYDVGVAGLHRLMRRVPDLIKANVVIAVAGMEGALPSVVGGLMKCPVIAVPTSVGYGASFNGLTALLAMLNSCAAGITVVNIDNGFG